MLKKLNAALMPSDKTISYKVDMAYYEEINGNKPAYTMRIETTMNKDEYWASIDGNEYYGNDEWNCVVNHIDKTIFLSRDVQSISNVIPDFTMLEALANDQGLELVNFNVGGNAKGLRFEATDHTQTQIDIIYDPKAFLPKEAIIRIDMEEDSVENEEFNNCRIEVVYTDYQFHKKEVPYSLGEYVKKTAKGFVPSASLSHYQIYSF
ncbi:MAG: hypothetical protein MI974_29160 [Chitinophagales bacterium]|nr:hypothetical protein [Chitinophagales bacterium]